MLQRDPLTASIWYWLSIALNAKGQFDEPEQAARLMIELQPQSDVGFSQLTFVLTAAAGRPKRSRWSATCGPACTSRWHWRSSTKRPAYQIG